MRLDNAIGDSTNSYSAVSSGFRVSVVPRYDPRNSNEENNVFTFSYLVTIENIGSESAQLVSRDWLVFSNGIKITEVSGPGVIGMQPTIKPREIFRYESSTIIRDPVGSMSGHYTFVKSDGSKFLVEIPRFKLLCPHLVH
ncbi:MAG TPA: Co2+/Mg2+ efflux protein ApaG [Oligoflexia bacterium]|nr:Co2+/Mg2+ efflux protein ApaG [Oligoflexia bacterium]HMP26625.1 Co2+/Mg2+ efflux protein ApaG [Oligoflexia bacterium]